MEERVGPHIDIELGVALRVAVDGDGTGHNLKSAPGIGPSMALRAVGGFLNKTRSGGALDDESKALFSAVQF